MITTFTTRVQTPDEGFDWLFQDSNDERMFRKEVGLPPEAEPWGQCTDQQRRDWEEQHPDPEPSGDPANVPADPANEGKEAEV